VEIGEKPSGFAIADFRSSESGRVDSVGDSAGNPHPRSISHHLGVPPDGVIRGPLLPGGAEALT